MSNFINLQNNCFSISKNLNHCMDIINPENSQDYDYLKKFFKIKKIKDENKNIQLKLEEKYKYFN